MLEFKENLSGKLEEIKSILDSKNNEDLQQEVPLLINEPVAVGIYKKFGLDPNLLKNPHELDFREWCKHMREKSEKEENLT